MSRLYCSYFDHRYLARGVVMIRSLRRHMPDAEVWVLCLSAEAETILRALAEPGVHPVSLAEIEAGDAELARAKADGRGTVEYYFTLTPSLVRYVMNHAPGAQMVTYLDGDLWFTADPEPVYREMGDASVLIIPHGFADHMRHMEEHGIYNVGWVSFRNDARGRACLEWWRDRNNEWCFDYVSEGRYADQGYLDQFPKLFEGVHVLKNRGANLAPWNVAASPLTLRDGMLHAGQDRVTFFHFHGLKRLADGRYLTSHGFYKAPLSALVRDTLYRPYLGEVIAMEQALQARFGALEKDSVRDLHGGTGGMVQRLKAALKMLVNRWRGYVIAP